MAERIAAGKIVRVMDGPLKGLEGTFVARNRGRVIIAATLRNGRVTVTARCKVRLVKGRGEPVAAFFF